MLKRKRKTKTLAPLILSVLLLFKQYLLDRCLEIGPDKTSDLIVLNNSLFMYNLPEHYRRRQLKDITNSAAGAR